MRFERVKDCSDRLCQPVLLGTGLDTTLLKPQKCAAARSTRLRRLHFSTAETAAAFSPEGVNPQESLKSEIQTAADHSEIISGPVDDAET